jgi:O-methyltransferase involved in polyketide biosynthesis
MTPEKIHFTKEKETMLMTLNGRAIQSQWKNPILHDPWAEEAMQHIDYDINKSYRGVGSWGLWSKIGCTIIATRAATFDLLTTHYLAEHPDAVVLHVGCGMDSRVFRVDPPASVQWFDVDYPDVIDLRRQLFPKQSAYHLIGTPLSDLRWLDEVPENRPALLLAEGVLHYLSETEVKALLNAVVAHFPGGQMIFDICNSWIVKRAGSNVGGTGATYKWGLDDPQDIKQLEPKLELIKEFRPGELVAFSRFPLWWRTLFHIMEFNPTLRRMERIVAYRYENASSESRSLAG